MTQISISIPKDVVAQLPSVEYPGGIDAITVIDNAAKARIAVRALKKCTQIGFDTETKPSFTKGQTNKVALLQLSSGQHCYLFRLNVPGIFEIVRPVLEDPAIMKIGLSVHDDFNSLRRRGPLTPAGFLDLQDYAQTFHIKDISLQKIYAIIFGEKISKAQRLTNWEASNLTEGQQIYASIDAWACLKLYRHMRSGGFVPSESPWIEKPQDDEQLAETALSTESANVTTAVAHAN